MRFRILAVLFLIGPAAETLSATTPEAEVFYRSLLDRGCARYATGNYPEALSLLRIASFGALDDLPSFERANIYIALSSSRIGDRLGVVNAVAKVTEAERIAPTFSTLNLGTDRAAFETLARPLGFIAGVPRAARRLESGAASPSRAAPAVVQPPKEVQNAPPGIRTATPSVPTPTSRPSPVSPPKLTESMDSPKTAIKASRGNGEERGSYALQIAIACEQRTVETFRKQFYDLRAEPIRIKGRSCSRVITGNYSTAELAGDARNAVRRKAGLHDTPIVVRNIPEP